MMTTSPMYALTILVSLHGSMSRDTILTLPGMKLAASFIFIEFPTVHERWKIGKGETQDTFFTFVFNLELELFFGNIY